MNFAACVFRTIARNLVNRPLRRLGLLTILAVASYLLIANYSHAQQQPGTGQWMIEFRPGEEKVQVTMRYDRKEESGWHFSSNGFSIDPGKFTGLSREQVMSAGTQVQFQLSRDAGTFNFDGWFKEGNGSGHFTFSPNSGFAAELNRQGYGAPNDDQLLSLAMNDIGFAVINELKAQGYERPTLEQLVRMGNHGVRLEYLQGLKSYGYQVKTIDYLIKMRDHGVSLRFISGLSELGYK